MWRRHGSNFNVDSEAYDIARGLYDSKGKQQMFAKFKHCIVLASIVARLKRK